MDFQFEIQTSGGSNRSLSFALPTGAPTPVGMSNQGTSRWHAIGFGYFGLTDAAALTHGTAGAGCGLFREGAGTFRIYLYRSTEVDIVGGVMKGQFVYYAA